MSGINSDIEYEAVLSTSCLMGFIFNLGKTNGDARSPSGNLLEDSANFVDIFNASGNAELLGFVGSFLPFLGSFFFVCTCASTSVEALGLGFCFALDLGGVLELFSDFSRIGTEDAAVLVLLGGDWNGGDLIGGDFTGNLVGGDFTGDLVGGDFSGDLIGDCAVDLPLEGLSGDFNLGSFGKDFEAKGFLGFFLLALEGFVVFEADFFAGLLTLDGVSEFGAFDSGDFNFDGGDFKSTFGTGFFFSFLAVFVSLDCCDFSKGRVSPSDKGFSGNLNAGSIPISGEGVEDGEETSCSACNMSNSLSVLSPF